MGVPGPSRASAVRQVRRYLALYLAALLVVCAVVGLIAGSVTAALITFLVILATMPFIATAMRVTYQKRKARPVRGYWQR